MFVCALVNIPNIVNYASSAWSDGQPTLTGSLGNAALIGSALCDQTRWVTCGDCQAQSSKFDSKGCSPDDLYGAATCRKIESSDGEFYFKENLCRITIDYVIVDFITIIFLFVSTGLMGMYQRRLAVRFDEKVQTASDYSLTVCDPCLDALSADEWRNFFSKYEPNGDVTCVCVAVDNEKLLALLVKQRVLRNAIETGLMDDEVYDEEIGFLDPDNRGCWERFMNRLGLMKGLPLLHEELLDTKEKIKAEVARVSSAGGYSTTRVYVTFESEEGQRNALNTLSTGLIAAWTDSTASITSEHRFRGQNVLKVEESREPSAVRWLEIGVKTSTKYLQRAISNTLTAGIIVGAAYAVWAINKSSEVWAAVFISLFNTLIPILCTLFNSIESHASQGGAQESLYVKIAIARWANTAVVIFIVTPFTYTLTDTLLYQVYTVLFADVVSYPLFRIFDFAGYFQKFILAPIMGKVRSGAGSGSRPSSASLLLTPLRLLTPPTAAEPGAHELVL